MDRGDPEIPRVQEARQEMQKTVKLIYLASWQQTTNRKEWKDFVSADAVKVASKPDVNRQMCVFNNAYSQFSFISYSISIYLDLYSSLSRMNVITSGR